MHKDREKYLRQTCRVYLGMHTIILYSNCSISGGEGCLEEDFHVNLKYWNQNAVDVERIHKWLH